MEDELFPDWGDDRMPPHAQSNSSVFSTALASVAGESDPAYSKNMHGSFQGHASSTYSPIAATLSDDASVYLDGAHAVWGSSHVSTLARASSITETANKEPSPPPSCPAYATAPFLCGSQGPSSASASFSAKPVDTRLSDWDPEIELSVSPVQLFSTESSPCGSTNDMGWEDPSLFGPRESLAARLGPLGTPLYPYEEDARFKSNADDDSDFGDFVGIGSDQDLFDNSTAGSTAAIRPMPPPPAFSASLPSRRQASGKKPPLLPTQFLSMRPMLPMPVVLGTAVAQAAESPSLSEISSSSLSSVKSQEPAPDAREAKFSVLSMLEVMAKKTEAPCKNKEDSAQTRPFSPSLSSPLPPSQQSSSGAKTAGPMASSMSLLKPRPATSKPSLSTDCAKSMDLDDFDPLKPTPAPRSGSAHASVSSTVHRPTNREAVAEAPANDEFGDWVAAMP